MLPWEENTKKLMKSMHDPKVEEKLLFIKSSIFCVFLEVSESPKKQRCNELPNPLDLLVY